MSDSSSNLHAREPNEDSDTSSSEGFNQALEGVPTQQQYPPVIPGASPKFADQPLAPAPSSSMPTNTGTRGMYTAAAVLNWVTYAIFSVATLGVGLLAGFWVIPMTIAIHKGAKGPYKHTGLGVCTLLFINIISGILMLVDDGNRPAKPA